MTLINPMSIYINKMIKRGLTTDSKNNLYYDQYHLAWSKKSSSGYLLTSARQIQHCYTDGRYMALERINGSNLKYKMLYHKYHCIFDMMRNIFLNIAMFH